MNNKRSPVRGYSLLDALVALLLVVLGLYAAVSVQTHILRGSGDAKSRSKAIAVAQANLEAARSIAIRGDFDAIADVCDDPSADSAYTVACNVSTPAGSLDQRLVQVTVAWTDRQGQTQRVALNSLVGWENVAQLVVGNNAQANPSIAPLGSAKVGVGVYSPLPDGRVSNGNGTATYRRDDGRIELIDEATGNILLYIDRVDGQDQDFVQIKGNVYFDQNAGNNALPASSEVRVRLSSEGLCIYDNAVANLFSASGGSNAYKYFAYTCYVGSGWYGNVGVTVDDDVSGQAATPTVCLGDPAFNNGTSNGTLTSPHTREASVRTYRGFKASGQSYLSTGMQNGSLYPSSLTPGSPQPSQYTADYPVVTNNYFNHHFLLTRIQGNASCLSKMQGGVFAQNSGQYFCIAPDDDPAADACPSVWPGFSAESGTQGSINYSLVVAKAGNGDGMVVSSPTGISCGTSCSSSFASGTSVTLTATASNGSSFAAWSGCDSATGSSCTVTMNAVKNVTATFTGTATSYALAVSKAGTGTGTVVGSSGGLDCGTTCTASYSPGSSVTLTATAASGSAFAGWSGACTGTGTCTVTMSQALSVTATFNSTTATTCTMTISGSLYSQDGDRGEVALASPAGAGTCARQGNTAAFQCSVSVAVPSTVVIRNFLATGQQSQRYDKSTTVPVNSCGNITNVTFP